MAVRTTLYGRSLWHFSCCYNFVSSVLSHNQSEENRLSLGWGVQWILFAETRSDAIQKAFPDEQVDYVFVCLDLYLDREDRLTCQCSMRITLQSLFA